MNSIAIDDIMRTPTWLEGAATISASTGSIPAQAWRKPLSRHLRLHSFVGEVIHDDDISKANQAVTRQGVVFPDAVRLGRGGRRPSEEEHSERLQRKSRETQHQQQQGSLHPIHVAASQGILKLGKALLDAGEVDASLRDGSGKTALHWSAMTDRVDFAEMLLEHDAAMDATDHQNRTALFSAAAFGSNRAAMVLLKWGAEMNAACVRGLTPLHAAAAGGHDEVVDILIAAGADKDRRSTVGASPRHVAEREGNFAIAKKLSKPTPFALPKSTTI